VGWLEQLQRWIVKLLSPRKKHRPRPKIIKRWYGKNCAVLRIERNTRGGISTYRITSLYGSCDYLLTLDYLPDLLAEMVGEYEGTPFRLGSSDYPSKPATHRFAIWRVFPNGDSAAIGIYDVDLEGLGGSFNLQQIAPRRAIAGVALRSLQIIHSTKTPSMSWHSQMERMDWLGLLETRIRGELQNPYHNLRVTIILSKNE